jgi:acyl-CoA reductase-like NAD-dependent aldehyde dehydrogenase
MPTIFIDNQAGPSQDGRSFDTLEPGTGGVLASLARGGASDVDRAVRSAKKAQPAWARTDPNERQRLLWKVGERIMERLPELAMAETRDTGKPISNSRNIDVPRTADTFFYFSGWATKLQGDTIPVRGPYLNYTLREPLGVIGAIVPWNFPLLLAARKIAPALAAGNTVVVKPPEEASLSCVLLAEILAEVGLPPGALNVITGYGHEAGAALVDHPDVAKISFTGGTDTGRMVMANAARTLKKLGLELGGKSANIIFADADVDAAAAAAAPACFYNQGELCTAGSRLLVERSVYDRVVEGVVAAAQKMEPGDPLLPATALGALISSEHRDRVLGWIGRAEAEGARALTGGARPGPGWFVAPTVLGGVSPDMAVARNEVFGPVLSIIPFDTVDEAAAIADGTEFGLAAGVWTRDIGRAHHLAARLKAGSVWINTYNRFDAASPYGGMGQSGFGRLNGRAVLDDMTQVKSVWVAVP